MKIFRAKLRKKCSREVLPSMARKVCAKFFLKVLFFVVDFFFTSNFLPCRTQPVRTWCKTPRSSSGSPHTEPVEKVFWTKFDN